MKSILTCLSVAIVALAIQTGQAAEKKAAEKKCPVSGEPINPKCTLKYEGKTYCFCCGKCRTKFDKDLKASLYHRIGGKKAINAAVDAFYKRVLADKKVNHFFEDVNMKRQHSKQKAFLAAAFGGPTPWTGKDMRAAHKHLELKESDFNAIAASTKDAVLNKK